MNAPLRVFSTEVVEAPSIALVVATRSLLGSAELEKLGDSLAFVSKKARSQSSPRAQFAECAVMEPVCDGQANQQGLPRIE
jgi:hypothetical protein